MSKPACRDNRDPRKKVRTTYNKPLCEEDRKQLRYHRPRRQYESIVLYSEYEDGIETEQHADEVHIHQEVLRDEAPDNRVYDESYHYREGEDEPEPRQPVIEESASRRPSVSGLRSVSFVRVVGRRTKSRATRGGNAASRRRAA